MKNSYALNLALELDETDFDRIKEDIIEAIEDYLDDQKAVWEYLNTDEQNSLVDKILYDIAKDITNS